MSIRSKKANLYFESREAVGYAIWQRRLPEYLDVARTFIRFSPKPTRGLRLLEVGCAGGGFLDYCEHELQTEEAVGIDLSRMLLASAASAKRKVVLGSALQLPIRERSVDCVIAVSLLHHLVGETPRASLENDLDCLGEMGRVLRTNGMIIVKEDIAVKGEFARRAIFHLTKALARSRVGVGPLKIYPGEVLAFLSPPSFDWLTSRLQAMGFRRLMFQSYFRAGTGLPRILIPPWEQVTCKLLACYIKQN